MSKLQTVKIVARTDAYGAPAYDVVSLDGYTERGAIGSYDVAKQIAERIDAKNIEHGNEYIGAAQ
jgi:hypothetical protein